MKKITVIYWVSTGLFCAFLFLTGISYITDPKFVTIFRHFGFPSWFRVELAIAKILGVIVLLIPGRIPRLKEWAYAAFGIMLLSAFVAHFASGDPVGYVVNVVIWFSLLVISYIFWHKKSSAPAFS